MGNFWSGPRGQRHTTSYSETLHIKKRVLSYWEEKKSLYSPPLLSALEVFLSSGPIFVFEGAHFFLPSLGYFLCLFMWRVPLQSRKTMHAADVAVVVSCPDQVVGRLAQRTSRMSGDSILCRDFLSTVEKSCNKTPRGLAFKRPWRGAGVSTLTRCPRATPASYASAKGGWCPPVHTADWGEPWIGHMWQCTWLGIGAYDSNSTYSSWCDFQIHERFDGLFPAPSMTFTATSAVQLNNFNDIYQVNNNLPETPEMSPE